MVLTIVLSLGAALFLAIGFVIQQHAAAEKPTGARLSFRLLLRLVQRPLWLGGVATQAVGQVLGAIALGSGALGLVEPVMAANLLFALPLSAAWNRRRLGRREWTGAAALMAGLATFIAVGNPRGGHVTDLPWPNWVYSGGAVAILAVVAVSIGKRRPVYQQATLFATGAGMLFGLQDALTQRTMAEISHGFVAVVINWPAFTLVAVAVVGMVLSQSAFEEAPLDASLPVMTALEPVTGIAFGVGVYHETLNLSAGDVVVEIIGLAVALAGVYLVATSPIVAAVPPVGAPEPAGTPPAPRDTEPLPAVTDAASPNGTRAPRRRDWRAWAEWVPWRERPTTEAPPGA